MGDQEMLRKVCTNAQSPGHNSYTKYEVNEGSGPEVIKLFSYSTQLSTKFNLLIKTRLPTNEEVFCFKTLRCCIYHANKC